MLQLFSIHVWIKFLEALGRTSPGPFIISYVKLWSAVIMKSTVGWIVHFSSTSFLFLNSVYPVTKIGNEMTTGCIRQWDDHRMYQEECNNVQKWKFKQMQTSFWNMMQPEYDEGPYLPRRQKLSKHTFLMKKRLTEGILTKCIFYVQRNQQ